MNAIGSSLLAVTAFGAATALNYATSGLVDWRLAVLFVAGGAVSGLLGTKAAHTLGNRRGTLNVVFATIVAAVGLYMLGRVAFI